MYKIRFLVIVLLLSLTVLLFGGNKPTGKDLTQFVNPFIGTVGNANTFPGPTLPFAMVQLSPYIKSNKIYGFSHTHNSGSAGGGSGVKGDVLFMPIIGDFKTNTKNDFASSFSHTNETAAPGYYKVLLDDSKIKVELTTTTRAGLHRYTFPDNEQAALVLDLGSGEVSVKDEKISGYTSNNIFFIAEFSQPIKNYSITNENKIQKNSTTVKGNDVKGFFSFDVKADKPLLLKVAISPVSVEGAKKNLAAELPGWDFNLTREKAKEAWNKELGKIEIEGGTKDERIIFYTSLYHSMIHPNIYMDVDKQYRSTNGKVYTAEDFDNYTTFSLWDTFRAVHPLFTIIDRTRTNEYIATFLERYDHTGRMLIMEFAGIEGEVAPMIGYHSLSVVADAYVKDIKGYDVEKAYKAMVELANDTNRKGKPLYLDYGFIPADLKGQSVSRTLEYSYDDWCVTRLAKDFDQADDLYFSQRGEFYKNVFDTNVNFMRGRMSNFQWVPNFDPMETINHYTEANAYQYTTFVPQDIDGLMELMGGDKKLESWLDACFNTVLDPSKINVRDVSGLIGQYAHGNEPSHHIAYLYNYAGTPWKTQEMVRKIMSTLYQNTPDGID
ncbi:Alpha-1,2-mannosidase, partial [hydrothermal vent metagenome]